MVSSSSSACPLCAESEIVDFWHDRHRNYLQCSRCLLVFVPEKQHLSVEAEKVEYDLHQNSPNDKKYRGFLGRLASPLQERLRPGSIGLDFGCGSGPTISLMLNEGAHQTAVYDPIYFPDDKVFDRKYDFITATEVVEHLRSPGRELDRLWLSIRGGGWLGIMTKLVIDREAFSTWHYKNDLTHICFFSRQTFRWWAEKYNAALVFVEKDVVLFRKQQD